LEDSCADARNLPRSLVARLARWSWQRSFEHVLTRSVRWEPPKRSCAPDAARSPLAMRAPGDCNPRPRHHDLQLRSRPIASEACAPRVGKIARFEPRGSGHRHRVSRLFTHSDERAGTGWVGWYAGLRRILFATEWSAARRKPIRAAAMHISAAISADV